MKMTDVKEVLTKQFENYFPQFGIELVFFDKAEFRIIKKKNGNCGYTGFGKFFHSKGFSFQGGVLTIQYQQIEEIVFPLIIKYKFWDTVEEPKKAGVSFGYVYETALDKELRVYPTSIFIATEEDLMKFFRGLKYYIEGYFLPWLEKYNKLEEVNEFINRSSMSEVLDSFAAPFPTQLYRAMVVASYCNNHDKVKELKDECLRLFEYCKTKYSYAPDKIKDLYDSLDELSGLIKNLNTHVE